MVAAFRRGLWENKQARSAGGACRLCIFISPTDIYSTMPCCVSARRYRIKRVRDRHKLKVLIRIVRTRCRLDLWPAGVVGDGEGSWQSAKLTLWKLQPSGSLETESGWNEGLKNFVLRCVLDYCARLRNSASSFCDSLCFGVYCCSPLEYWALTILLCYFFNVWTTTN